MGTEEPPPCMFCLNTMPDTLRYDGPCDCKPHVHTKCLETWFKITPNECPICRTDYDPPDEETTAASDVPVRAFVNTEQFSTIVLANNTLRYHFQCFLVFFLIVYLAMIFELADN